MPNLVTDTNFIQEDGEETEFILPEMEEEEQDNESITYLDSHRKTMERLRALWPDKFKVEDEHWLSDAHLKYNYKGSTPRLLVDTKIFKGGFFDATVWPNEDPDTGVFPFNTRFARGACPYRKGYRAKPPGRPFDMVFSDPVIGDFLGAPKFGTVHLDHQVFNTKQSHSLSSDLSSCCDFYMRQALTDACYTDNLLSLGLQLMSKFRDEMLKDFDVVISPAIDFMQDMWALSSFSNQRSIHNMTAAVTANRAGLRRKLLNKFKVHPKTRQLLTYSSFTGDSVFGRLPESFLKGLRAGQQSHMVARDKTFSSAGRGRGRGQKRTGDFSFPGPKKSKLGEHHVYDSFSVFFGKASNPRGGGGRGASRGRGKSGGRGRAKN